MNDGDGIKHEISHDAIIRHNIVSRNGFGWDNWLWGSQILVQNSHDVEIYDNLIEIASNTFGNGISVIHQNRGESWNAINNYVHDNTITHLGDRGLSGVVSDTNEAWFWHRANNRFDRNVYVVLNGDNRNWAFNDSDRNWSEVKELGYERNGELIVEERAPMELACDLARVTPSNRQSR